MRVPWRGRGFGGVVLLDKAINHRRQGLRRRIWSQGVGADPAGLAARGQVMREIILAAQLGQRATHADIGQQVGIRLSCSMRKR